MSIFNQLVYREDRHLKAAGISGTAPLYPHALVSITELQAAHALEIALSGATEEDTSLYSGLRLTEGIRGYSVLAALAERAARETEDAGRLLIPIKREDLAADLERLGLRKERGSAFIEKVTFSRQSRDVVDEPIILTSEGQLLLLGPAIINAEVARILLSKLARERVSFERRGRRFENEMRERFATWGLQTYAFSDRRGGDTYEFDLVVPWDNFIFVFECKSRSPIGIDPARAWQALEHLEGACDQVSRLCAHLRRARGLLRRKIGEGADSLVLVPCVLNALPLQTPQRSDGVHVTDLAAVATFFELGEVGAYATHRLPGLPPLRQPIHAIPLWSGERPRAQDFLRFLEDAPTRRVMEAHLELTTSSADIDGQHRIQSIEVGRAADSVAKAVETLGGDGPAAIEGALAVSKGLAGGASEIASSRNR